ncbi:unnamed protein product [Ceutorhynchus assimilis]|uniref:Uncharacterized protein n=1 Tax=Ceutorhynchus assimilis TaxID=467358 RepID=A0A9N9MMM8_9CUCU|nr:unnamed protein product [Ceutorhynchus assimilis]
MASYLLRIIFRGYNKNSDVPEKNSKAIPVNIKSTDSGSGDCISETDIETVEKSLIKQEKSTQRLLTSLDHEIAQSKLDIGDLRDQLCNAEEDFPKRSEILKYLETESKKQMDLVATEMIKLEERSAKHDMKLKEIEQKLDSWQWVINRAKEAHVIDLWDSDVVH